MSDTYLTKVQKVEEASRKYISIINEYELKHGEKLSKLNPLIQKFVEKENNIQSRADTHILASVRKKIFDLTNELIKDFKEFYK